MTVRATACGMGANSFTDSVGMVEYAFTVRLKAASVVAVGNSDIIRSGGGGLPVCVSLSGLFNDGDAVCVAPDGVCAKGRYPHFARQDHTERSSTPH